ncbi:hypothetical protein BLNAU_8626 [Blattamonas nauphoetae]|uniref:Wings apart-like protein C-terminal domain-containing protein n=1 Tax=Blattamonas nauphoetae TaxID=2049346 RepID=A0ABQ9XY28_9EUKA|nr:hypothetical protein BLNAU_8626 [Blattamonas nauphoetae]
MFQHRPFVSEDQPEEVPRTKTFSKFTKQAPPDPFTSVISLPTRPKRVQDPVETIQQRSQPGSPKKKVTRPRKQLPIPKVISAPVPSASSIHRTFTAIPLVEEESDSSKPVSPESVFDFTPSTTIDLSRPFNFQSAEHKYSGPKADRKRSLTSESLSEKISLSKGATIKITTEEEALRRRESSLSEEITQQLFKRKVSTRKSKSLSSTKLITHVDVSDQQHDLFDSLQSASEFDFPDSPPLNDPTLERSQDLNVSHGESHGDLSDDSTELSIPAFLRNSPEKPKRDIPIALENLLNDNPSSYLSKILSKGLPPPQKRKRPHPTESQTLRSEPVWKLYKDGGERTLPPEEREKIEQQRSKYFEEMYEKKQAKLEAELAKRRPIPTKSETAPSLILTSTFSLVENGVSSQVAHDAMFQIEALIASLSRTNNPISPKGIASTPSSPPSSLFFRTSSRNSQDRPLSPTSPLLSDPFDFSLSSPRPLDQSDPLTPSQRRSVMFSLLAIIVPRNKDAHFLKSQQNVMKVKGIYRRLAELIRMILLKWVKEDGDDESTGSNSQSPFHTPKTPADDCDELELCVALSLLLFLSLDSSLHYLIDGSDTHSPSPLVSPTPSPTQAAQFQSRQPTPTLPPTPLLSLFMKLLSSPLFLTALTSSSPSSLSISSLSELATALDSLFNANFVGGVEELAKKERTALSPALLIEKPLQRTKSSASSKRSSPNSQSKKQTIILDASDDSSPLLISTTTPSPLSSSTLNIPLFLIFGQIFFRLSQTLQPLHDLDKQPTFQIHVDAPWATRPTQTKKDDGNNITKLMDGQNGQKKKESGPISFLSVVSRFADWALSPLLSPLRQTSDSLLGSLSPTWPLPTSSSHHLFGSFHSSSLPSSLNLEFLLVLESVLNICFPLTETPNPQDSSSVHPFVASGHLSTNDIVTRDFLQQLLTISSTALLVYISSHTTPTHSTSALAEITTPTKLTNKGSTTQEEGSTNRTQIREQSVVVLNQALQTIVNISHSLPSSILLSLFTQPQTSYPVSSQLPTDEQVLISNIPTLLVLLLHPTSPLFSASSDSLSIDMMIASLAGLINLAQQAQTLSPMIHSPQPSKDQMEAFSGISPIAASLLCLFSALATLSETADSSPSQSMVSSYSALLVGIFLWTLGRDGVKHEHLQNLVNQNSENQTPNLTIPLNEILRTVQEFKTIHSLLGLSSKKLDDLFEYAIGALEEFGGGE